VKILAVELYIVFFKFLGELHRRTNMHIGIRFEAVMDMNIADDADVF
jgi:hypothetical protein